LISPIEEVKLRLMLAFQTLFMNACTPDFPGFYTNGLLVASAYR
jgi:hypothetical protein